MASNSNVHGSSGGQQRTTMAAMNSNHGNNKNVNKIAMNAQKEQDMVMSDYAVDAVVVTTP